MRNDYAALAGRILLSIIFIVSGVGKLMNWKGTESYMVSQGMPSAPAAVTFLLVMAVVFELGGGLALLAGWQARLAAVALVIFLIPATFIFHDFWTFSGEARQMQMVNFLKNLAIMGGLAQVIAYGSGRLSLGARGSRAFATAEVPAVRTTRRAA